MLANRSVQVFLIIMASIAALSCLIVFTSVPYNSVLPALLAVIGVGVGIHVTPPPNP